MAKRGPKPKTARQSGAKRPAPRGWDVPAWLSGEAASAWTHLVGQLAAAGNLDRTDPVLVESYAVNVELLRKARASIESDGVMLVNGVGNPAVNPACAVVNSATMRIKAIVADLGLCPATSKYAAATGGEAKRDDKWSGLLGVIG